MAEVDATVPTQTPDTVGRSGARAGGVEGNAGDRLGRYVLLETLGAGGMGVVYRAFDPDLARNVALKVITRLDGIDDGEGARERLLVEARAAARLSHPNVVQTHDVGVLDDRVFVAMELVVGRTLDAYCASPPRDGSRWRAVVDAYIEAGKGLAAAHDAGLVHRDFKPANVIVGDADGRVRVLDFGLARSAGGEANHANPTHAASEIPEVSIGRVLGTPRYMAPEQHLGESVRPSADVFAFCVSLHRELYGSWPFAGETSAEIAANVVDGRRTIPNEAGVPRWILPVLARGLERDPAERWPTLEPLLSALSPPRRRVRGWMVAVALVGLGVLASMAFLRWDAQRSAERLQATCADEAARLTTRWQESREVLRTHLRQMPVGYSEFTASAVIEALDERVRVHAETLEEGCLARGEGPWPKELAERYDRQDACWEDVESHMVETMDQLLEIEVAQVQRSVRAVHALPRTTRCLSDPLPPRVGGRDEQARKTLLRVESLLRVGRFEQAREEATQLAERVLKGDDVGLQAEVLSLLAATEHKAGAYAEGKRHALDAIERSERAVRPDIRRRALGVLLWCRQRMLERDGLLETARLEHAVLDAIPHDPIEEAETLEHLGIANSDLGHYDDAEAAFRRSAELRQEFLPASDPAHFFALGNLAVLYARRDRLDDATTMYEEAIVAGRRSLGPNHPDVATMVWSRATNVGNRKGPREGVVASGDALAVVVSALGETHPKVAQRRVHYASLLTQLERWEESEAVLDAAKPVIDELPDAHPDHHWLEFHRVMNATRAATTEDSIARWTAWLAEARGSSYADNDPATVMEGVVRLALARAAAGQLEQARTELEGALEAEEDDRSRVYLLLNRALIEAEAGHAASARGWIARARDLDVPLLEQDFTVRRDAEYIEALASTRLGEADAAQKRDIYEATASAGWGQTTEGSERSQRLARMVPE